MTGSPAFGLALAATAGTGVHLLVTSARQQRRRRGPRAALHAGLVRAGLDDIAVGELVGTSATLAIVGGLLGYAVFGGALPAVATGLFASTFPAAAARHRRSTRTARAAESWPRLIEEIRLLTGSLGRSIPQALFEVGQRAPDELRPAFAAAQREWLLSTDFERTLLVLKDKLADASADATCETLLVAHELGGADLDRRLLALAEDRQQDVQGRKDARSRQAGVRFARRFVLVVPFGMAVAGMSVGNGRDAYAEPVGQALVVAGTVLTALCWAWAGRMMRLPREERVFR